LLCLHLQNYAEDALKEVLGWYGLRDGTDGAPPSRTSLGNSINHMTKMIVTTPSSTVLSEAHKANQMATSEGDDLTRAEAGDNKMVVMANSNGVSNVKSTAVAPPSGKVNSPIDLTNGQMTSSDVMNTGKNFVSLVSGSVTELLSEGG